MDRAARKAAKGRGLGTGKARPTRGGGCQEEHKER